MKADEAIAIAHRMYYEKYPPFSGRSADISEHQFTVPPDVFDTIERHLEETRLAVLRPESQPDALLMFSVPMFRGTV